MNKILFGLLAITAGSYIVVFRSRRARYDIEFQNKTFGFHFGEKDIRRTTYVYAVIGIALVGMGIMIMLGIIEPK